MFDILTPVERRSPDKYEKAARRAAFDVTEGA
jgi:hypothetical protein